jgi:hypothetical protein
MADPHASCASQFNRNFVFISHQSGKGLDSAHDPEGQKGAACSELPVFGRELSCISTCHQVKRPEQESVRLTQSAGSLAEVGLAKS